MIPNKLFGKKIVLLPEYPLPIVYGGLEIQCVKTLDAVKKTGVNVSGIDYYKYNQSIDILHIFGNPPGMFETCFFASHDKKIVISTFFGGPKISRLKTSILRCLSSAAVAIGESTNYLRTKKMIGLADHIIVLNKDEKLFVIERYKVDPEKITIIPSGVDEVFFKSKKDVFFNKYKLEDFVLFTGNIIKRKNPLNLAKAIKKVGVKGVFIGKPFSSELGYSVEFQKEIDSSSNLFWIQGIFDDVELLASAYKASAVFCLPSSAESQSLSCLEAMASGKPLVIADRPYSYQNNFNNALKCDPNNINSIAEALQKALDNKEKYSYQLAESYSWDNIAKEIIKVYEKIIL